MDEIKNMTVEELEERKRNIAVEVDGEGADLDALTEEVRNINAELESRKAEESKKAEIRSAVAMGEGTKETKIAEERKEMNEIEKRNTPEYIDLYAEYLKTGSEEKRAALLTENVSGEIAVPEFVYDIIKTAWEKNEILSRVRTVEIPGNLKVNFEIAGSDAVLHVEGSGAVDEQTLAEGIVTLVPSFAKKWKSFSDEVMALRGESFIRYIYDEITYHILKAIADDLVTKIAALPAVATATSPNAVTVKTAPAIATVATAMGNLSDEAANPVVIINKATWSAFKAIQYAGGFNVDPFEGLDVLFSSALPAYADASENDVYMIVGDLGEGALANFPAGQDVDFTFDTISRKKEDLVEVLGKLYVATAPVSCKAFALVSAPAQG